jgi:hypothetical protein
VTQTAPTRQTMIETTAGDSELSPRRLNVMRFGYAFLGVGLAIVKWPILIHGDTSGGDMSERPGTLGDELRGVLGSNMTRDHRAELVRLLRSAG